MKKLIGIYVVLFLFLPSLSYGQACCTAGTPLLNSLELPATQKGNLELALTYDYNNLDDNIQGTRSFDYNIGRERKTKSGLLEVSYGLTDRISLSGLVSFVQQERSAGDFIRTRGFGDMVILFKYSVIPLNIANQRAFAIGAGPKIPLAKDRIKHNGIFLNPDIQPGSGTWDAVFWAYGYQGFLPTTRLNLFGNASYRISSEGADAFRFGNEFTLTSGTGYRTDTPFDLSVLFRYRHSRPFKRSGADIENTGGHWLYIVPGLNIKFKEVINLRLSGQLPIYRNLQGTQLTTSYTTSVSLFYSFSKKEKGGILGDLTQKKQ